jgi:hypothetical protein
MSLLTARGGSGESVVHRSVVDAIRDRLVRPFGQQLGGSARSDPVGRLRDAGT